MTIFGLVDSHDEEMTTKAFFDLLNRIIISRYKGKQKIPYDSNKFRSASKTSHQNRVFQFPFQTRSKNKSS